MQWIAVMRDEDIVIHPRRGPREQRPVERSPMARDEDIVFRRRFPRPTPEPESVPAERSI